MHILKNIPYNLAKRIIIFTSDEKKVEKHLIDLREWLIQKEYPIEIINKSIHNARLQGPAPKPAEKSNTIPFVTTNFANLNINPVNQRIRHLIKNCEDEKLKTVFKDTKIVNGLRQPKSLRNILVNSKFFSDNVTTSLKKGLNKCERNNCNICQKGYLQVCQNFKTAKNTIWNIKCNIHCNSKNVIYYLICNMCCTESYIGKTNAIRARTNNHISCCRNGTGSNIFDNHVYKCGIQNQCLKEPFFKLYAFLTLKSEHNLLTYEKYLQEKRYDMMNT